MTNRHFERYEVLSPANWDFFSFGHAPKSGMITNISRGGCLLRASEPIEHRRWLRIMATGRGNLHVTLIGRVTRCENVIDISADRLTLYRYGVEFARPGNELEPYILPEEPSELFAPVPENVAYLALQPRRKTSARRELGAVSSVSSLAVAKIVDTTGHVLSGTHVDL